jgi:hypothetical protein
MSKLPRSPYLNVHFKAAVQGFGTELLKTSQIKHTGSKGSAREEPLRAFFRERLPKRFAVTHGEAVDLLGNTSPQMDLMFYDQNANFPLGADVISILPAEGLLATVEVKSCLDTAEVDKSVIAAKKLRVLKPFARPLAGKDVGSDAGNAARLYHCIFAYDSNLKSGSWLENESARLTDACSGHHLIDAAYIVGRGFINIGHSMARREDTDGGAITAFYFSILNFIQRESNRRKDTPYERYFTPAKDAWIELK